LIYPTMAHEVHSPSRSLVVLASPQLKTKRSVPSPKGGRVNGEAGEMPAQSRYCIRGPRRTTRPGSQVDQPNRDVTTLV
jgi:hypothetical protein